MELMFQPLRKYADFQGRARRSEYWLFVLFEVLLFVGFFLLIIALVTATRTPDGDNGMSDAMGSSLGTVLLMAYLGLLIPRMAVLARRLHDSGNSAWLMLLVIVPFGGIALFVFTLLDGTVGANQYGPDPKGRGQPRVADTFS